MRITVNVNDSVWATPGSQPRAAVLVIPPSVGTTVMFTLYMYIDSIVINSCVLYSYFYTEMCVFTNISACCVDFLSTCCFVVCPMCVL